MKRPSWGTTLRGVLLRFVFQCLATSVLLGAVGFAVGGWVGARNGAVFGLLAGAVALPFLLEGIVAARGGGVEEEGHQVFYEKWYGGSIGRRGDD